MLEKTQHAPPRVGVSAGGDDDAEASRPLARELNLSADELVCALLALDAPRRLSLLDSCGSRGASARYLVAGFDPEEVITARGDSLHIVRRGRIDALDEGEERVERGDVLDALDERLKERRAAWPRTQSSPASEPFSAGACIATFSYDLADRIEQLRTRHAAPPGSDAPHATLAFYDTLAVHDYETGRTKVLSVGGARRLEEACATLERHDAREHVLPSAVNGAVAHASWTRDEYERAVAHVKDYIFAGDIYQANLTQQFICRLPADATPEQIFLRLRREHPASFAAFIRRDEDVVVSASPERFLRVEVGEDGRRVESWPTKGTRPRGATASDDARLREELLVSEKDRAENVMIVDLMRNDLGRVCQYGSVEVLELCAIEEHPTLFHLVSKVRGRVRDDATAGDLLRATFPCGSVTGAPKIRAMEIIAELETLPRGLSMGALGYFAFDGSLDLSVAIRTMVVRGRTARFNVGGGVVADSCPSLEYEESLVKARALLRAVGVEE
ncbi:MAG TPA: aminodeoxychorismate synthase component I [Pyrinomonadaceae bacterium]|nr:aminodeoxychorismate synthase component I [Pyrinomonadaceae bacterium]